MADFMNDRPAGLFSLSIQSIEWQVKNLFQEAGGEKAVELMDRLAGISESERDVLLDKFLEVVSKIASAQSNTLDSGNLNSEGIAALTLYNSSDAKSKTEDINSKLEDQIVNYVLTALENPRRLTVLDGGKNDRRNGGQLIDFASAKKNREERTETSLN